MQIGHEMWWVTNFVRSYEVWRKTNMTRGYDGSIKIIQIPQRQYSNSKPGQYRDQNKIQNKGFCSDPNGKNY